MKTIYGNAINLAGLYSAKPIQLFYHAELKEWYDKEGDFSVSGLGIGGTPTCVTFASGNKKDVEVWTSGVATCLAMLKQWATAHEETIYELHKPKAIHSH